MAIARSIKSILKKSNRLVTLKRAIYRAIPLKKNADDGVSTLNLLTAFPLFAPNSKGAYEDRAVFTLNNIKHVFPLLKTFSESAGHRILECSIESFVKSNDDKEAAENLKKEFDRYGSDKSAHHNYELFYGPILKNTQKITAVCEIGIGTNHADIVSHMGAAGHPGASLRAFRDFLPKANIYGADIDRRILFSEERIKTHFVDQLDDASFKELQNIPEDLDLFIDDGLHAVDANIISLQFGLQKIKVGGWAVIEDIAPAAVSFWHVVGALLPKNFHAQIFAARKGYLFCVKKLVATPAEDEAAALKR